MICRVQDLAARFAGLHLPPWLLSNTLNAMYLRFMRALQLLCSAVSFTVAAYVAQATPEAFEVGPFEVDDLPKGKVAEGIIGDFILRNDKVEAVISGNLNE